MEKTLANFPPEVFSVLTYYLPYDAVETLWRVNNRKVIAMLSQLRGCLQLLCEATARNPHWPILTKHLQMLTSLTVTSRPAHNNDKAKLVTPTYDQLMALPKSLVSIRFDFPDAELCWCNVITDVYLKKDTMNIGAILPNLQRLELSGTSAWRDNMEICLPASLMFLCLENNDLLTDKWIPKLPVHLSHLWLPRNSKMGVAALKTLQLISIRLSGHGNTHLYDNLSQNLPEGLLELELPGNKSFQSEDVAHLPRQLRKLNLQLNSSILPSAFSSFPTTLQALNISTKISDGHIKLLPSNMAALALNDCSELTSEAFGILPRSLTHFTAWNAAQISDEAIGLLPKGLKHLYLDSPLTDIASTALPSSLLTLKLREATLGSQFMAFLHLPHLTRLELSGENFYPPDIQFCPRSLRYLHLTSSSSLSPDAIPLLPPNIRVLSFISSSGFKNTPRSSFPPSLVAFYSADLTFLPNIF